LLRFLFTNNRKDSGHFLPILFLVEKTGLNFLINTKYEYAQALYLCKALIQQTENSVVRRFRDMQASVKMTKRQRRYFH